MNGEQRLDGTWRLKDTDGRRGGLEPYCLEGVDERTFVEGRVPGEVHLDLLRQGRIGDPREGTNALAARWVEERYWIYRRTFVPEAEALRARRCWLVFDALDTVAEVYLNGEHVGGHANRFRPCRLDVTEQLREGENLLAVLVEAGLHAVGERPAWDYDPRHQDGPLHKRMWLRKPQYEFGWDWNPRLINVGIPGSVRLEWCDDLRLDQVTVYPELADDHSEAQVHARLHLENAGDTPVAVTLRLRLPEVAGAEVEARVNLPPGSSTHALAVRISRPRLWWPRPHGDQALYRVCIAVERDGRVLLETERRTGIRSVRINQDPHPVAGRYFLLEVNGVPVFCKGGNWVPADMIPADVDSDRLRRLVELAGEANFNLLRIWGGGLYADHTLLDLCDEAGILVWHDFIFACAKYPADDPAYLADVRAEVTHVTRELSAHPSLVVWCGNNELEWGMWDWGYESGRAHPDHALFHYVIPTIVKAEDPSRPYWPSSPYSPEHEHPNSPLLGDQHPWHVTLGWKREDFWAYREDVSRFPNEGGALGASSPATLRQFLPEGEQYYLSPSWEYHDNEMGPRAHGLMYEEWFATWLGLDPARLTLEDYAYYSALLQSEALLEYIHNYRRRMFSSASAVFWMYNDSWPVTHGWTIVDYYLRRKLAYHPVRRAFDPVQTVVAVEGDQVLVFGVNDRLSPWEGEARFGLVTLDGAERREERAQVVLAPNAATLLSRLPLSEWEALGYRRSLAYATLWRDGRALRQSRLFMSPYKELDWPRPEVRVEREGDRAVFHSDCFAWGVCLDPDGEMELPDDTFDLLPGVPWAMPWPADRPLPDVRRIGNL